MISRLIAAATAASALLVLPFAAEAADVPMKNFYKSPPRSVTAFYNWTGLYAGFNLGYGSGTSAWDVPAVTLRPKGMMYGATLGYNWQMGSIVYGVEGDFNFSTMKESAACDVGVTCETKNTWLGTARGRIGYAFDRFLPYVTAGGAFGNIKATRSDILGVTSASATKFGWAFGGGLEYAFLSNWSAKLEYLYVDLGKFDCGISCGAVPDNVSFKANLLRFGLNYKFSGPVFSRF
jgi:outer membrane immunogenic protein